MATSGMAASNSRLATLALHLRPDGRSPAAAEAHATAGLLNYIKGLFGGGAPAELRVGMIGLDTSHVPAFTDCLNNPENEHHVPGAKVVAAVKGGPENKGSADMPSSRDRVEGYSKQLVEEYGVQLYDTVEEMCEHVDCVFLESVDGRPHLAQAAPVIAAGKALFIDKPMAGSLADALEIFRLAEAAGVPVWSASAVRFGAQTQAVRAGSLDGPPAYAETSSPATLDLSLGQPDLFGYGIHGCDSLFAVMGTGCERVKRGTTPDGSIEVTGYWAGGRVGVFREANPDAGREPYTGMARGAGGAESEIGENGGYALLMEQAIEAFKTGVVPIPPEETIELLAFMEAADLSKARDGAEVTIAEVMEAAAPKA